MSLSIATESNLVFKLLTESFSDFTPNVVVNKSQLQPEILSKIEIQPTNLIEQAHSLINIQMQLYQQAFRVELIAKAAESAAVSIRRLSQANH